jgi:hypothetical protein
VNLRDKLISLLTQFDEKQSKKRFYNRNALAIYFEQLDRIVLDIELGAEPRAAIVAGFNGYLCDFILKNCGFAVTSKEEKIGSGIYRPVSKNHPDA